MNASETTFPNSKIEIQKRVAAGKITWAGPLIMASARTVLGWIFQALAVVLFFRGSADPWVEAAAWWRTYGTLVDVGCIVLLVWLTRREGIRLFDLGNYRREGWLRDVGYGVAMFILLTPFSVGGIVAVMALLQYSPPASGVVLPTWATLYRLIIWWVIWAPVEDMTYVGYAFPRLERLTGGKWLLASLVTSFFTVLQHSFFPFGGVQWQVIVANTVGIVPSGLVIAWLYLRWRRLLPFHVAHWLTDFMLVLTTSLVAGFAG
jgi:membrane protease YdiL (CAAX protease family)